MTEPLLVKRRKDKIVQFRLRSQEHELLEKLAKLEGEGNLSVGEYARLVTQRYLMHNIHRLRGTEWQSNKQSEG